QCQMFEQPDLDNWVIYYPQRDERVFDKFLETMKQSIETFGYPAKKPRSVSVRGKDAADWIREIENTTDQTTRAVVFLLEGRKKAAPLY
ncbi:hypothetical protein RCL49_25245, partial [Salmonella enterica subsp. enterica serovar Typhimurium]